MLRHISDLLDDHHSVSIRRDHPMKIPDKTSLITMIRALVSPRRRKISESSNPLCIKASADSSPTKHSLRHKMKALSKLKFARSLKTQFHSLFQLLALRFPAKVFASSPNRFSRNGNTYRAHYRIHTATVPDKSNADLLPKGVARVAGLSTLPQGNRRSPCNLSLSWYEIISTSRTCQNNL